MIGMHLYQRILLLLLLSGLGITAPSDQTTPQQWRTLSPLSQPRQEHGTVALDNATIAVVGGTFPILNGSVQSAMRTTDSLQLYDITSNSWRNATPAPFRVNHPNVAAVGGRLYLLGGLIDSQTPSGLPLNWVATGDSYMYDPAQNLWTELQAIPPGMERGSAAIGVDGELIYLAGGMTVLRTGYQDAVSTVIAYNTTSNNWQRLPPAAANIPEGRQHVVGGIFEDTFYVIGGRWFGQTNGRDTVFRLDMNNLTAGWTTGPTPMPTARGGLSGDLIGNKYYTFGGEGNPNSPYGIFNQTEVYDFTTQTWTSLGAMPVPRHGTRAVAVNNAIYIPGGGRQQDGRVINVDGVVSRLNASDHFDAFLV